MTRRTLFSRLLFPCIACVVSLLIVGVTAVGLGQYELRLLKSLSSIDAELTALARLKANVSLIDSKLTRVLLLKERESIGIVLDEADKIQYLVGDYRKLIKERNDFIDLSNLSKHETGFDQIMSLSIRVARYIQADNDVRAQRIYDEEYAPAFNLGQGLFEKAFYGKPEQRDALIEQILFLKEKSTLAMLGVFLFSIVVILLWLRKAYKDIIVPVGAMTETIEQIGRAEDAEKKQGVITELSELCHSSRVEEFHTFSESLLEMHQTVEMSEQALKRRTKEAEQANVSKSQFLASMSHEIRTPMNGVLGMAQLLLQSDLDEDQTKKMKALLRSGDSLLVILNEILDYSKIEAGKLDLESINVNLSEIAEDVGGYFSTLAHEKGVEVVMEVDELDKTALVGDPTRIRQVLNNLASNAIKFTQEGQVTIGLQSHVKNGQADVVLTVKDSGIGISESALETIFDPFSQAESSTTRKFGGTGLGLTITHNLVEMMGGTIEVTSQLSMGTTFIINMTLPVSDEQPEEQEAQVTDVKLPPMKILVVDDTPINVMILKMMLEKLGHQVDEAEDGQQALQKVQETAYDMVFMDYHMPNMDGREATIAIRNLDHDTKDITIIGCTADAFKEALADLKAIGQNAVITKPVDQGDVMNILVKYHSQRSKSS